VNLFSGQVPDNFNGLIKVDVKAWQREEARYVPIPDFYRFDNLQQVLERNRISIQNDIRSIVGQTTTDHKENEAEPASKERSQSKRSSQPNQKKRHA
jgi:hypothetical protein